MRRILVCALFALFTAQLVSAEVTLTERRTLHNQLAKAGQVKTKPEHTRRNAGPGKATGSQGLIDASGFKYFINTNITFSTSSSASGAMSEASYTHAVAATTMNGGTTSSTLNDAFDGYGAVCIGLGGATGPCETGNASYVIYDKNGPPTTDCGGRQIDFPAQTIAVGSNSVQLSRKVFVPTNDTFARTLNILTNTGATSATFNLITSNNLGSDKDATTIVSSSNGNNTAETTDTWLTSFQQYGLNCSGGPNISCDPRLGHVFQGPGATTPMSFIHFVDLDDQPYWDYTVTLAPGETKIITTFVTGQPSKAAAAAKAAQLVGLPDSATQCLTATERQEFANFGPPPAPVPTLGNLGLAILCLALAAFAVVRMRRRTA